ncbi:MAG: hypothetical protein ACFCUI_07095 [Bernardetiaceae bacterium]
MNVRLWLSGCILLWLIQPLSAKQISLIKAVHLVENGKLIPIKQRLFFLQKNETGYHFILEIDSTALRTGDYVLSLNNPLLDQWKAEEIVYDGKTAVFSGELALSLPSSSKQLRVYIPVQERWPLHVQFSLQSLEEKHYMHQQRYYLLVGFAALSGLGVLVFGGLALYRRRGIYAGWGLLWVWLGVYGGAIEGLWSPYLGSAAANDQLQNFSGGLLFFLLIYLVRYWLQSHRTLADLDIFARFLAWLNVLLALVSLGVQLPFFTKVCYYNHFFSVFLVFFLLLLRQAQGVYTLGIAVRGSYLGLMGFLMVILRTQEVIADSFLNLHSIILGLSFQCLFLSVCLLRDEPR